MVNVEHLGTVAAILAAGTVTALALPGVVPSRSNGGPDAPACLRTLTSAQEDFRAKDRDRNGKKDFWRGDIAGLYTISVEADPIQLIEPTLALADDRPMHDVYALGSRGPKAGYWFRAIRHADERAPGPNRFAACAFPEVYDRGRKTYVVDERNTIYARDLGRPGGVDVFPDGATLEREWARLD